MHHTSVLHTRAGFTLMEVLITLTIIAAIISIAIPTLTGVMDTKDTVICTANLKSIGGAIHLYYKRFNRYPNTASGVQFLLAPLKSGIISATEKNIRGTYICPGDDEASATEDVIGAYQDLDNLDPKVISYAGRNTRDFPLRRKNADREVIACDAGGLDGSVFIHKHKINVLYLDGTVSDIDVLDIPGGEAGFSVGPDSQIPMLRKLNKKP